jgi:hypothetical protein
MMYWITALCRCPTCRPAWPFDCNAHHAGPAPAAAAANL